MQQLLNTVKFRDSTGTVHCDTISVCPRGGLVSGEGVGLMPVVTGFGARAGACVARCTTYLQLAGNWPKMATRDPGGTCRHTLWYVKV